VRRATGWNGHQPASRPGYEMLLLAAAGRDTGATSVVMFVLDMITRPGVLPDGMSRRWGA
jgi:hypothetical protein